MFDDGDISSLHFLAVREILNFLWYMQTICVHDICTNFYVEIVNKQTF